MDDFGFTPGWIYKSDVPGQTRQRHFQQEHAQQQQLNYSPTISHHSAPPSYSIHPSAASTTTDAGIKDQSNQPYAYSGFSSTDYYYGSGHYEGFGPIGQQSFPYRHLRQSSNRSFPSIPRKARARSAGEASYPPAKRRKQYATCGKSAAMILNEIFPEFRQDCKYETLTDDVVPRFKCCFTIRGVCYSAEASSKKVAKQLACERALRALRPDISIESTFEEVENKRNATNEARRIAASKKMELLKKKNSKNKLDPLANSNSLHDYFLKRCEEHEMSTGERLTPDFSFTVVPRNTLKHFKCSLNISARDKQYVRESIAKSAGKNCVIKDALMDIFGATEDEMKEITKQALNLRPGKPIQVLQQALNFYGSTMQISVEAISGESVNGSAPEFVSKITLDNNKTITGEPSSTADDARHAVCLKVLEEELGLSMPTDDGAASRRIASLLSPCYALHHLLLRNNKNEQPNIIYDDARDISGGVGKPPLFECRVTINDADSFVGKGTSKKAAKTAAADIALRALFNFDMQSKDAIDILTSKNMKTEDERKLCARLFEFVRAEYDIICLQDNLPFTTFIAAFVIVKPNGEYKLASLGTGHNAVADSEALSKEKGTILLHLNGIVLARRAFLLYLYEELQRLKEPDCIFELSELTNKYRLKPDYKIIFYTSSPPNTQRNAMHQKLFYFASKLSRDTESEDGKSVGSNGLTVMSIADKLLKWNHLGIQGALLSNLVEPIFISKIYVGSISSDREVFGAVLLRYSDARKGELTVKSMPLRLSRHADHYYNWIPNRGNDACEGIDPYTFYTKDGLASRLSKKMLFGKYIHVMNLFGRKVDMSYLHAKKCSKEYNDSMAEFIENLKVRGLGIWHKKLEDIDDFNFVE